MKHKINWASIAVSASLLLVLLLVIAVLWSLSVSGPARAYEQKLEQQVRTIQEAHTAVGNIERHVFRYVTYTGEDDTSYYWFNEEGQVITTREKTTRDDEAARTAVTQMGYTVETVTLGYGYEGPAYLVYCTDRLIVLDYDSREVIYEREVMHDEQ